jgi:dUTP pyrophosphatase
MQYPPLIVKKLFPDSVLPVRANPTDSGLDVCAYRFEQFFFQNESMCAGIYSDPLKQTFIHLHPNNRVLVHTGIAATVGPGYEIQVRPRSGNALKRGLIVVNSPGTIDESYRGALCVIIANVGYESQEIKIGEKIAQLVVCPVILSEVQEVTDLDKTVRGAGGFGSTGQ